MQRILLQVSVPIIPRNHKLLLTIFIFEAVNNFFPTVVGGLGYDRNTTYGLTAVSILKTILAEHPH